jgi:agmatinase
LKESLHFLSLPNSSTASADVLILPVPYERTVTYKKGTRLGPEAILAASSQLEFYEEDVGWCPMEYLRVSVLESVDVSAASEEAFHGRLFESVQALADDVLFIALGGEHSITPEMVFARMPMGGTIVQIDAHADLRPSYHGSPYNHACPMYRLLKKGYHIIQIGIRSLHAEEAKLIAAETAVTTYFDRDLRQAEHWRRMLRQIESLSGPVWLSIDMDGFDPTLISGVGTPQPGGIDWYQGLDMLSALMNNRKTDLRGVDIVELVPEVSRVSEMMAAKLVQKCISYWAKSKGFDQGPANGSQIGVDDE